VEPEGFREQGLFSSSECNRSPPEGTVFSIMINRSSMQVSCFVPAPVTGPKITTGVAEDAAISLI